MKYSYEFDDIPTGPTADLLKTFMQIIVADTAGLRCRIRSVALGPADNTASDENVVVKLKRINDVSAGGAGTAGTTISVANVIKKDRLIGDSPASVKLNYSSEPTTYEASGWTIGVNGRGGFIKEWSEEDAPVIGQDQAIGLLVAPRSTIAVRLSGSIEWESF